MLTMLSVLCYRMEGSGELVDVSSAVANLVERFDGTPPFQAKS